MGAKLNGIIFDDIESAGGTEKNRIDIECPLTQVYKSNICKTVRFRDKVTKEH